MCRSFSLVQKKNDLHASSLQITEAMSNGRSDSKTITVMR
jgi:hypothetical protein